MPRCAWFNIEGRAHPLTRANKMLNPLATFMRRQREIAEDRDAVLAECNEIERRRRATSNKLKTDKRGYFSAIDMNKVCGVSSDGKLVA
jgi:hypothetical protein